MAQIINIKIDSLRNWKYNSDKQFEYGKYYDMNWELVDTSVMEDKTILNVIKVYNKNHRNYLYVFLKPNLTFQESVEYEMRKRYGDANQY